MSKNTKKETRLTPELLRERNRKSLDRLAVSGSVKDRIFQQELDKVLSNSRYIGPDFSIYKGPVKKETDRVLNLLWSDLHFHSLLSDKEVSVPYGPVEEARRMARIVEQAVEYKRDHRSKTKVAVHLAGDIIQNQLHDHRDGAPLAEQFAAALHILVQAIVFLAKEFKQVDVGCVPGNHGRNTARHHQRAVIQKWDSIENMIYYSLKKAVERIPNVTVNIPYKPYYLYESFGFKTLVTHGDTVIKPGFPGSNIEIGNIVKQINAFNAQFLANERVSCYCVGHVHTGSYVPLNNGSVFISNGALIPSDQYAESIGLFSARCGQMMWEGTPDFVVGDVRYVGVDQKTDQDRRLDKIIQPFRSF